MGTGWSCRDWDGGVQGLRWNVFRDRTDMRWSLTWRLRQEELSTHYPGMNPSFCGFDDLFLFFSKLDSTFVVVPFKTRPVYFCFSLWESRFLLFRDAGSGRLHRLVTSIPVKGLCLLFHIKHVLCGAWNQLSRQPFGKLEDGWFYSRASLARHFTLCLDQWSDLERHFKISVAVPCLHGRWFNWNWCSK